MFSPWQNQENIGIMVDIHSFFVPRSIWNLPSCRNHCQIFKAASASGFANDTFYLRLCLFLMVLKRNVVHLAVKMTFTSFPLDWCFFPQTFSILNDQRSNSDSDPCATNWRALSATVNLYFEQEATMKALQEGVTKYRRVPKIVHQENRLRLIGSIHIW